MQNCNPSPPPPKKKKKKKIKYMSNDWLTFTSFSFIMLKHCLIHSRLVDVVSTFLSYLFFICTYVCQNILSSRGIQFDSFTKKERYWLL